MISSRPELSANIKVDTRNSQTKYAPVQMTDASVYDLARHWYTAVEIAETFNVTPETMLAHHGDAFRLGKKEGMLKPRMLLNKILSDFEGTELNFARPDVPVNNLLKAIELHAKKYEGLGSKQTIVHEGAVQYDKVESKPIILERPDEAE